MSKTTSSNNFNLSSPDIDKTRLELRDNEPGYSEKNEAELVKESCFEPFEERLEEEVDEDRDLHDIYGVASTAMEIGLSVIEGTDKDALALVNEAWLENGKHEELKEALIDSMKTKLGRKEIQNLEELSAEEVLEVFRKLNGREKD